MCRQKQSVQPEQSVQLEQILVMARILPAGKTKSHSWWEQSSLLSFVFVWSVLLSGSKRELISIKNKCPVWNCLLFWKCCCPSENLSCDLGSVSVSLITAKVLWNRQISYYRIFCFVFNSFAPGTETMTSMSWESESCTATSTFAISNCQTPRRLLVTSWWFLLIRVADTILWPIYLDNICW